MIVLKSPDELAVMRAGGRVLAEVLDELEGHVVPGVSTGELDAVADRLIAAAGARPSAKGYRGFPGAICVSVNEEVVHGIPGDRILAAGDLVTLDVALQHRGYHVDSARTLPVGDVGADARALMDATAGALEDGLACCLPGRRLGDVGHAVQSRVEGAGFSVVAGGWCGHGIGRDFHEDPPVHNRGAPGRGLRIKPGMTFALEPMVAAGAPGTRLLADGWTVVTADGSLSAHFEHTVAITADGCEVLTRLARTGAAAQA